MGSSLSFLSDFLKKQSFFPYPGLLEMFLINDVYSGDKGVWLYSWSSKGKVFMVSEIRNLMSFCLSLLCLLSIKLLMVAIYKACTYQAGWIVNWAKMLASLCFSRGLKIKDAAKRRHVRKAPCVGVQETSAQISSFCLSLPSLSLGWLFALAAEKLDLMKGFSTNLPFGRISCTRNTGLKYLRYL